MNIKLTNTDYFFIFSVLLLYLCVEISKLREPLSLEQKIQAYRKSTNKDYCAAKKERERIAEEDALNKIKLDKQIYLYQKQHDQKDRIKRLETLPKLNPHTVLSLNVDDPKFQPGYGCVNVIQTVEDWVDRNWERIKREPKHRGLSEKENPKYFESLKKEKIKFMVRRGFEGSCGDEGDFPNNEYPTGDFLSKGWTGSRQKWICNKEKNTLCRPTTQWQELEKYNKQKENERIKRKLEFDTSSDWEFSNVENTQKRITWYPYAGKTNGPITIDGVVQETTYDDRLRNSDDAELEDVIVSKRLANRELAKPIWSDVVDFFPMDLRDWEREEPGAFDPSLYMSKKEKRRYKKQKKKEEKRKRKQERQEQKEAERAERERQNRIKSFFDIRYWRKLLNIK
tara:strand:- start:1073 stop:2263 length:1191 start_codon:yes stop_codon:yes gene_type:complete